MSQKVNKIMKSIKNGSFYYMSRLAVLRRKHLFFVNRKDIKELLIEDLCYKKLKKKYSYVVCDCNIEKDYSNDMVNKVWIMWLQGIENAPELVKKCYRNNIDYFGKERVVLITKWNLDDYIQLPKYIMEKYTSGKICHAHFSDIVRVSLLCRYGGIWIDSTVYINKKYTIPDYILDSNFFLFSNMKRNSVINISNWFILSSPNNPILEYVKAYLFEYWKKEKSAMHYFIFHLFFSIACEKYDCYTKMLKFSNVQAHILANELNNDASEERLDAIMRLCPIQKLSYKIQIDESKRTMFDLIMEEK